MNAKKDTIAKSFEVITIDSNKVAPGNKPATIFDSLSRWPEYKDWILWSPRNPGRAECRLCRRSAMNLETAALEAHAASAQHTKNIKFVTSKVLRQCRTCLKKCAHKDSTSVWVVEQTTQRNYAMMLRAVTGVKVKGKEILCEGCRMRAFGAFKFREMARRSDLRLNCEVIAATAKLSPKPADIKVEVKSENEIPFIDLSDVNDRDFSDGEDFSLSSVLATKDESAKKPNGAPPMAPKVEPDVGGPRVMCGKCRETMTISTMSSHSCVAKKAARPKQQTKKTEVPGARRNTCIICGKPHQDALHLLRHLRTAHDNRRTTNKGPKKKPEKVVEMVKMRKGVAPVKKPRGSRKERIALNVPLVNKFRCGVCSELFNEETELDVHCREHGSTEVIMCGQCERVYFTYSQFKRHFAVHHADLEDVVKAPNTRSIQEVGDEAMIARVLSFVRITSIGDLISAQLPPQQEPQEVEAYVQVCGLCGMVIFSPEELKTHNVTEHPDFNMKCYYCLKDFSSGYGRELHLARCRATDSRSECVQCGQRFSAEDQLASHIERRHRELSSRLLATSVARFMCEHCGRTYSLKRRLMNHYKYCGPLKDVVCDVCNKSFTRKGILLRHIEQVHCVPNSFLCSYCGKSFKRRNHLERHIRFHTGEKPYQCDMCPMSFAHSHSLKYHKYKHTGDSPYRCEQCNRVFNRGAIYRRHMMIHTGERPHRCDVCGDGFIQKNCLIAHMRKHGPDEESLKLDPEPFKSTDKKSKKQQLKEEIQEESSEPEMVVEDTFDPREYARPVRKTWKKKRHSEYEKEFGFKRVKMEGKSLPCLD